METPAPAVTLVVNSHYSDNIKTLATLLAKCTQVQITGLKVADLKKYCIALGFKPSQLKKAELIRFLYGVIETITKNIPRSVYSTVLPDQYVAVTMNLDKGQTWRQHLLKYGWATSPIPDFDSNKYVQAMLNWLHSMCPAFDQKDSKTWTRKNMPIRLHGIFKYYIGHLPWIWEIREKCLPIFTELWRCKPDELLTSFDGGCFLTPKDVATRKKSWFHCDQNRIVGSGFICVQGVVNLLNNGPQSGGLVLIEGSHSYYKNYLKQNPSELFSGFSKINMEDPEVKKSRIIKVCAPAGHILLWDSRVFHCNTSPTFPEDELFNIEKCRMCTYVCMQPKLGANNKQLAKRIKAFKEGRMTNHWSYGPMLTITGKHPRHYGQPHIHPDTTEITTLNPIQKSLVGYSNTE